MKYYRNKQGTVVHLAGCERMAESAVPWAWAEQRSLGAIEAAMLTLDIKPCGYCRPQLHPSRGLRIVG